MDITTDVVVMSLRGHDKGGIFAVIGLADEEHAFIADGKIRKKEKPKKKKFRHLKAIGRLSLPEPSVASNRQLRQALKEFGACAAVVGEGGI